MKKSSLLAFVLLLIATLAGCGSEKTQAYFVGTVAEITDDCFVVVPDDEGLLSEDGAGQVLVPREVVRVQEVDFGKGERVRIVFHEITYSQGKPKIDVVYAIYRESELQ